MSTSLPDITEARPLGAGDERLVADLHEVLVRHDAAGRFGIALLHDHFPVGDDELLMETCDVERRTLTTTPVPLADLGSDGRLIETLWAFERGEAGALQAALVCKVGCFVDLKDKHKRTHDRVNG
jgi:hypothetical protein